MTESPVLACMRAHRSIRRFAEEPLSDAALQQAVEAAQMAATSSNIQAYSVLRIRDRERRARLAELCGGQTQVEKSGAFLVINADIRRHLLVAEAQGQPNEQNLECFLQAVVDASLFAQNLALALESMGYGICYIGGLRNQLPEVDELLKLPQGVLPVYGLCVGRPAEEPGTRPRLRPSAILFDEEYPSDEQVRSDIAEYDERMGRYYEERGKPGYDWSRGLSRVFGRKRREHLKGYYERKGASLS